METASPPSILIAGCGYLGTCIARRAHVAGWKVRAMVRESSHATALAEQENIPTLIADISNPSSLSEHFQLKNDPPTHIIHCASSGRGGPEAYRTVYEQGAHHLLTQFPTSHLLFTSSTSVYAQSDGSEVTEISPATPSRETGKILRRSEELVLAGGGVVTRLSGLYGPGRSVLLQKFLCGDAGIEGEMGRILNQVHIEDAASAVLTILRQSHWPAGEIFNVSDSTPLAQRPFYEQLAARLAQPLPPTITPDPHRKRGWTNKRVANTKLRGLGWNPRYPSFFDALENDSEFLPSIRAQVSAGQGGK